VAPGLPGMGHPRQHLSSAGVVLKQSEAGSFGHTARELTKLKVQLATPTYEFRNGKILIESKSEIKKRLGCSPDRADAYVNGLYAMQFVEGQLVGGRRNSYSDDFDDDFEDSPYGGSHSAMGM